MSRLKASPSGPLRGTAALPGDKSLSHRALILGALAEGETWIDGLLEADDVMATARAVRAFGAGAEPDGGRWRVRGAQWSSPASAIDCGNSATAARLLMGAAAGFPLQARFTGDQSLRRRPMARVSKPLARMGARIAGGPTLPLALSGGGLRGIDHVNDPASAQVKSAILLAGLRASGEVRLQEPHPSRNHTEIMLREFGCAVTSENGVVALGRHRRLRGCALDIAGDPSSAAFLWLAAAILPGSRVATPGVLANPLRTGFLDALGAMGARTGLRPLAPRSGEPVADVTVAGEDRLRPVAIAADRFPGMVDEIPALAIAAALARGESRIDGLAELRAKESDRLEALARGLSACGVDCSVDGDSLCIAGTGKVPGGAEVATQGDHRIAMAFAVLGLAAEAPVVVDRSEMIATSFPGFASTLRSLGARIDELE